MKFNEWITKKDTDVLKASFPDDSLLIDQLDQWVDKLCGLLHDVSNDKKHSLLEKVIKEIKTRIN
jgi:hypothetical protein